MVGDKDLKEETALDAQGGENDQAAALGVGALLRNEREKQGLTLEKVADATKLRLHVLEALEGEEWEALPSPVFVKGFIRSYARTLRLNDQEILALYERTAPTAPAPHRFYRESPRGGKWRILLVVVLIAAAGVAFYLWKGHFTPKEKSVFTKTLRPAIKKERPARKGQGPKVEEKKAGQAVKTPAGPSVTGRQEENSGEVPPREATSAPASPPPAAPTTTTLPAAPAATTPPAAPATTTPPAAPAATTPPAAPAASVSPQKSLVLRADITQRTWIRICVDEDKPKEYIFQPGSRPQWEAKKGFYLVVGNAGGATFEFNGKVLKDLGKEGQVVRLRLPKDFQPEHCEE